VNYLDSIEFSSYELDELHKTIGRNVAKRRKLMSITQLDLALSIGYKCASVIAKAEAGTEGRHFSMEQLYKISEALRIDICDLLYGVSKRAFGMVL
jgi:putative transcriptional regulator